jgi:hypothetical protein
MKKSKRIGHSKNSDSDTQSRTFEVGDGTTALVAILDIEGAKIIIRKIKGHVNDVRGLVYQFDVGEGWRALGYGSLRACLQDQLSGHCSESYLYRQLDAAKVERNLGGLLPKGKTVPERVLRPLHGLKPKQQCIVWKSACRATKREAPKKEIPTSTAIEEAIAKLSGKSSPQPAAKRTGSAKLSEKVQKKMEALGKQIVANHGRLFVQELIKWLGKHLPPSDKTQSSKHKS